MKTIPEAYWAELKNTFDEQLLAALHWRLMPSDPVFLTVEEVGAELDCAPEQIGNLLEQLAHDGYLEMREQRPCPHCKAHLTEEDLGTLRCHSCGEALEETAHTETLRVYVRKGQRSRDVLWVVTVHGMNTPGAWQQDFSWRLAKLYGYAVPVGIYKYGNIKLSPLIYFRQEMHRDRLLDYLRKLRDQMKAAGYGERPDVIAHSFGTWLLAQAILADTGADPIKVGRVVLTGSIVRPDFNWRPLLDDGRVEAVLCHYGGRDIPVRLAQYSIPDSGPSGRYGFNDQGSILHKFEKAFGHSDYFTASNLDWVMTERWAEFLTRPLADLEEWRDPPNELANSAWAASRWRHLTRWIKALLLTALIPVIILTGFAIPVGLPRTVNWMTDSVRALFRLKQSPTSDVQQHDHDAIEEVRRRHRS
jgi:hypothetical protein